MAFTIICYDPAGFRVVCQYSAPVDALIAFEAASRHALAKVGSKVQLLDGDHLVGEIAGPEPRPEHTLTELLIRLDPEYLADPVDPVELHAIWTTP